MVATCVMAALPSTLVDVGFDLFDESGDGLVDALLDQQRLCAGGHGLQALFDHGLRQHGRGGGAVAGDVVGLAGDFAHELRAHVLEGIFDFDLFGDGHAVVDDARAAVLLFQHDIAAARAKGHLDGIRQGIDAALQRASRLFLKKHNLSLP